MFIIILSLLVSYFLYCDNWISFWHIDVVDDWPCISLFEKKKRNISKEIFFKRCSSLQRLQNLPMNKDLTSTIYIFESKNSKFWNMSVNTSLIISWNENNLWVVAIRDDLNDQLWIKISVFFAIAAPDALWADGGSKVHNICCVMLADSRGGHFGIRNQPGYWRAVILPLR